MGFTRVEALQLKKQFHINSQRDLSICSRILVTKTLGFSKIIYPLSTQDINLNLQNKIQSTFNRYIWNYKPSKVKHSVLAGDYIQGGMRSLDNQSQCKALRLAWLERIVNGEGWNDIVKEYLSPYGGLAFLLKCNYDTNFLNYIPTFYRNMLDFANEIMIESCKYDIRTNFLKYMGVICIIKNTR